MTQNHISQSTRMSSLGLAVALLAVLGFLALRAEAEELLLPSPNEIPALPGVVREQIKADREEKLELRQEQQDARALMRDDAKDEIETVRRDGVKPPETMPVRLENREDARALLMTQQEERQELRAEQADARMAALEARREALRKKADERRTMMEERIEARTAKLSEHMQARLGQYVDRIAIRMNAALDRLTQIAGRIETRIGALEDDGIDLTEAREKLLHARNAIDVARADITAIGTIASEALTSETPRAVSPELREAVILAKESIKAVHQALRDTVVLIKGASVSEDEAQDGSDGKDGEDGAPGVDGEDGTDGEPGTESEPLDETTVE